jgi:hypothetical protein
MTRNVRRSASQLVAALFAITMQPDRLTIPDMRIGSVVGGRLCDLFRNPPW